MIDLDRIEHVANAALAACEVNALGKIVGRDVPALVARVRELEALLRCDNENMDNGWVEDADGWYRQCPWCGNVWTPATDMDKRTHRPDCPWQAAMETVRESA